MSLDHDRDELEELIDEEESRSVFSATWFRALLGMLALGVIVAVFLPYLLEWGTAPAEKRVETPSPSPTPSTASLRDGEEPAPPASSGSREQAAGAMSSLATAVPPGGDAAPALESKSSEPTTAAPAVPDAQPRRAEPKSAPPRSPSKEPSAKAPVKRDQPRAAAEVRRGSHGAAARGTLDAYWVQVGTFKDPEAARRLAARLRGQRLPASNRPVTISAARDRGTLLSRVRVGPFHDRATAASKVRELQVRGYKPFIAQERA
jgi:cell division septation protein DedD